jgi:hypothetical protein
MGRATVRRIVRLEKSCRESIPAPPTPLIIAEPGESMEQAIFRLFGEAGLPQRPVECGPYLVILPIRPRLNSTRP